METELYIRRLGFQNEPKTELVYGEHPAGPRVVRVTVLLIWSGLGTLLRKKKSKRNFFLTRTEKFARGPGFLGGTSGTRKEGGPRGPDFSKAGSRDRKTPFFGFSRFSPFGTRHFSYTCVRHGGELVFSLDFFFLFLHYRTAFSFFSQVAFLDCGVEVSSTIWLQPLFSGPAVHFLRVLRPKRRSKRLEFYGRFVKPRLHHLGKIGKTTCERARSVIEQVSIWNL